MARPLPFDNEGGVLTNFHFDWDERKFTLNSIQNVEPILKVNHELATEGSGVSESKNFKRVASLPMVVVLELAKQGILKPDGAVIDHARFKAFLNSEENQALRTSPGKV